MAAGAVVTADSTTVLPFEGPSDSSDWRARRKKLLRALRFSGSPVIVDLSTCSTLNHEDVAMLLECLAQVAGRDTTVRLVAGSRANRVLLEVTRISSLVPVFDSIAEAMGSPHLREQNDSVESGSREPGSSPFSN